ncbi:MAG: UPF0179 family protein [Methanomicrobiaceae archaeon]|nr:UPF0179 family protein [Methanomicrobiaceae archaeon]
MSEGKVKITLIGRDIARTDLEFVYEGPLPECDGCKVHRVCTNLQLHKRYRIVGIRGNTVHECQVHHDGVCAVEVIEAPIITLIKSERAIVNSKILFESSCSATECKSYELCHPEGIVEGAYYIVGEILGNAPEGCERGRTLKLVELRPV